MSKVTDFIFYPLISLGVNIGFTVCYALTQAQLPTEAFGISFFTQQLFAMLFVAPLYPFSKDWDTNKEETSKAEDNSATINTQPTSALSLDTVAPTVTPQFSSSNSSNNKRTKMYESDAEQKYNRILIHNF